MLFGHARIEGITFDGATGSNSRRHHVVPFGIHISKGVSGSPIGGRLLIGSFDLVVLFDYRIEKVREYFVAFRIGCVDSDSGIEIL